MKYKTIPDIENRIRNWLFAYLNGEIRDDRLWEVLSRIDWGIDECYGDQPAKELLHSIMKLLYEKHIGERELGDLNKRLYAIADSFARIAVVENEN